MTVITERLIPKIVYSLNEINNMFIVRFIDIKSRVSSLVPKIRHRPEYLIKNAQHEARIDSNKQNNIFIIEISLKAVCIIPPAKVITPGSMNEYILFL